jgi:hypothetical protein
VPADKLRLGDLVMIERENSLVTHRLLAQHNGTSQTIGDNCLVPDPPVSEGALLGRVTIIERGSTSIALSSRQWHVINRLFGWSGRLKRHLYQSGLQGRHSRLCRYTLRGVHMASRLVLKGCGLLFTRRTIELEEHHAAIPR